MIRSFLILGLFVLALSTSGCRAGGQQFGQGFGIPQLGGQNIPGFQQSGLGGILPQQQGALGGLFSQQQGALGGLGGIFQQQQQPSLGGIFQQAGGNLPNAPQNQSTFGQFGQNLGSQISNGVVNQGINRAVNGVISAF